MASTEASTTDIAPETEERPIGFGRLKRKEDPRFIRGLGKYVDDIKLPGMLHGAVLRSPFAHARIKSIDTSAAQQHPKVQAVITGQDLEGLKLAWMPTMSYDTQAVLATDKVRFQGQEVAFVVADDRYSARDALELIVACANGLRRIAMWSMLGSLTSSMKLPRPRISRSSSLRLTLCPIPRISSASVAMCDLLLGAYRFAA